jgi:hypothetical protein
MSEIKSVIVPKNSLPTLLTRNFSGIASLTSAIKSTRPEGAGTVNVIEYTSLEPHNLSNGDIVQITSANPSVFNISPTKIIVKTPTSFTVDKNLSGTPVYVSGGSVDKIVGNYTVRYRVVSEDRNRVSFWSPQYTISPSPLTEVQVTEALSFSKSNGVLFLNWKTDEGILVTSYDIFIAWGSQAGSVGLTEYVGSATGSSFTIPIPSGQVSAEVFIQTTSIPRKRIPDITIAATNGVIDVS